MSTLRESQENAEPTTPRRNTLRGTPKRVLESAKKLLRQSNAEEENFVWIRYAQLLNWPWLQHFFPCARRRVPWRPSVRVRGPLLAQGDVFVRAGWPCVSPQFKKKSLLTLAFVQRSRPHDVKKVCSLSESLEWSGDAFSVGKQIGSGSFATVFLGKHKSTGATFAIKKVPVPSGANFKRQQQSLQREIEVLRECRSPYVVSYYGCFHDEDLKNMCIVMEYLAGGTLYDVIKEYNQHGGLDEPSTHGVVVQVLRGLAYLHEHGFMHRDLKVGKEWAQVEPALTFFFVLLARQTKNILIDVDGSTKLADFGVSRALAEAAVARSMVGTPLFMAPEVLAGEAYTTVADVWSFGICVLHITNGDIPRRGMVVRDLMRTVMDSPAPTMTTPSDWSREMASFLDLCLQKNPRKRASAAELLASDWVTGTKEDAEATKTAMRTRTVGRAAGTPARRQVNSAAAVVAPSATSSVAPKRPAGASVAPASPAMTAKRAAPVVVEELDEATMTREDLAKELKNWKQLALKLMDEKGASNNE